MKIILKIFCLMSFIFLVSSCNDNNTKNQGCLEVICGQNAHCEETVDGSWSCICDDGYIGDPMSLCNENLCYNITCGENAHCVQSSGTCECDQGFDGDPATLCQQVNFCEENTCNAHGVCDDSTGVVICTCDEGYASQFCNECDSGYFEYPSGSGICTDDPCNTNPCNGNGTCQLNSDNLPECTCNDGYTGADCSLCDTGFVEYPADSGICIDDPCIPEPCSGNGSCSIDSENGTFKCTCNDGYAGVSCTICDDGFIEYPVNSGECIDDPCDPDPCNANGTCQTNNDNGSFNCYCRYGYIGDDCSICDAENDYIEYPVNSGECIDDPCNPDPCNGNGDCNIVSQNNYSCSCYNGYTGDYCNSCDDGFMLIASGDCVDNPCEPDPCNEKGYCQTDYNTGGFQCQCNNGYTGNDCSSCDIGYTEYPPSSGLCIDDPCYPDPCNGNGNCNVLSDVDFSCSCDDGYTGDLCNLCSENHVEFPQNSGICINDPCINVECEIVASHCTQDYSALTEQTGNCIPTGIDSYDCEVIETICNDGVCLNNACIDAAAPEAGTIVINEIMINPMNIQPEQGQWFEIYNTIDRNVNIAGLTIQTSDGSYSITTTPPILILANEYLIIGNNNDTSTNGNIPVDIFWQSMSLSQNSDEIDLISQDNELIDYVSWDDTWWHLAGHSLTLSPAAINGDMASLNDDMLHWCAAQQIYDGNYYASPTIINDPCIVDSCNLQFPESTTVRMGQSTETIYGQVYEADLTNLTDFTTFIIAAAGYGEQGTTPDLTWNWSEAFYNTAFISQDNEEFMARMIPNHVGIYDYVYQMSLDGGLSWVTCQNTGALTVQKPLLNSLMITEYVEGTSNNKAVEIYNSTESTINISSCQILIYFNGSTSPISINLSDTDLNDGEAFVICHSSFDANSRDTYCDQLSGALSFNGNDAVALRCNDTILDVIGQIGFDPGVSWVSDDVTTVDHTLRKKCTVYTTDNNGSDVFYPSQNWDEYLVDTFDDLGSHCGW